MTGLSTARSKSARKGKISSLAIHAGTPIVAGPSASATAIKRAELQAAPLGLAEVVGWACPMVKDGVVFTSIADRLVGRLGGD